MTFKLRNLLLVPFMTFAILQGCDSSDKKEKNNIPEISSLHYQSAPNDMAEIDFSLNEIKDARLYIKIIEPGGPSIVDLKGTWKQSDNNIIVEFNDNRHMVPRIFDEQYDETNAFKKINDSTIQIIPKKEIYIWGGLCIKQ